MKATPLTGSPKGVPERLPSGRHQLDVPQVQNHQRTRLIDAITDLCAERGYANVVIADIVSRAAVSKSTFYRLYETKEACLFDAHKHLSAALLAAVDTAAGQAITPEERLRAAIRTALEFTAIRPRATQLLTTGILSAGPLGAARYRTAIEALAKRLFTPSDGARHADAFAAALFAAPAVTAIAEEDGDPAALLSLENTFVEIALAFAAR